MKMNNTTELQWDEYGNPNPPTGGGDNMNNTNPGNLNMTALRTYITMYLEDIDAYGEEDELTEATNVLHDFVTYLKSMRGLTEGETDNEQAMIDYNAMEEEWEMDNYNEMIKEIAGKLEGKYNEETIREAMNKAHQQYKQTYEDE